MCLYPSLVVNAVCTSDTKRLADDRDTSATSNFLADVWCGRSVICAGCVLMIRLTAMHTVVVVVAAVAAAAAAAAAALYHTAQMDKNSIYMQD